MDLKLENGYDEIVEALDEPFIGGVESYSADNNAVYGSQFKVEQVAPPPAKVQRFTAFLGNAQQLTPKRRGRPPKAESERRAQAMKPKGAFRISLTPKPKGPRGRPPSMLSSGGRGRGRGHPPASDGHSSMMSPFPVINNVVKKPPGRPRIHPPKDPSVKKPRGRPRKVPLEGEKAWRTECAKLRRVLKKKDELIIRMRAKLKELGATVEEPGQHGHLISSSENEDDDDADNGVPCRDMSSIARGNNESDYDDNSTPAIGVTEETVVPSSMEQSHQTYVNMFAAVDNYNSDCVASNDDDDDDDDD